MYKNDHLKNVSPALWINHFDSLTKVNHISLLTLLESIVFIAYYNAIYKFKLN
jgi:hypothetical protein